MLFDEAGPFSANRRLSIIGERFLDFVGEHTHFNERDLQDIENVCYKIESDPYPERKTGEDYYTHLYEVAECYVALNGSRSDKKRVIASLLHDAIEDIDSDTFESLKANFGEDEAFYVHVLSKNGEITDKIERRNEYNGRFKTLEDLEIFVKREYKKLFGTYIKPERAKKIARMIVEIKICDRIHNLTTMPLKHFKEEKVNRKIRETEEYYLQVTKELVGEKGELYIELLRALRYAKIHCTKSIFRKKTDEVVSA